MVDWVFVISIIIIVILLRGGIYLWDKSQEKKKAQREAEIEALADEEVREDNKPKWTKVGDVV